MRRLTGMGLQSREFRASSFTGRDRLARVIGATAIMTGVAGIAPALPAVAQPSRPARKQLTAPKWVGADPVIAADAKGAFITAWEGLHTNCNGPIQIRLRSSAGKWGRIHQLTPCDSPTMIFPAAAYNANGYGVVAWLRTTD